MIGDIRDKLRLYVMALTTDDRSQDTIRTMILGGCFGIVLPRHYRESVEVTIARHLQTLTEQSYDVSVLEWFGKSFNANTLVRQPQFILRLAQAAISI